jgi:hypothetical protein
LRFAWRLLFDSVTGPAVRGASPGAFDERCTPGEPCPPGASLVSGATRNLYHGLLARLNGVVDIGERLAMSRHHQEGVRVGAQVERALDQAVKCLMNKEITDASSAAAGGERIPPPQSFALWVT